MVLPVDVFNILVWTLKLGVAAWYYLAYPEAGASTALLCGQLLEGALGGFWAWIGHRYVSDKVARSIGWPTGHRFQNEIAWMNAGICTVMLHGFYCGMLSGAPDVRWDAVVAAVLTHGTILLGCAETHFIALHEDGNWAVNNVGFLTRTVNGTGHSRS